MAQVDVYSHTQDVVKPIVLEVFMVSFLENY